MTLAHLLIDPIVSSLLSLDASARGEIVAACFSGMKPIEFWEKGSCASFSADFSSYAPVERCFFNMVESRKEEAHNFDRRRVYYELKHPHGSIIVRLRIIFTKVGSKDMETLTDIDMLAVNRMGLYIHTSDSDVLTRVPVPLSIVIKNCQEKTYDIFAKATDDVKILERQKDLSKLGFMLRQRRSPAQRILRMMHAQSVRMRFDLERMPLSQSAGTAFTEIAGKSTSITLSRLASASFHHNFPSAILWQCPCKRALQVERFTCIAPCAGIPFEHGRLMIWAKVKLLIMGKLFCTTHNKQNKRQKIEERQQQCPPAL